MNKPCILCCAITGSLPTKANNPAVPVTISEQVESSHAAFEAGASIIHAHVRNEDETPSSDPEKFGRLKERLEDNVRLDRERLAPSNAALVQRAAELCEKYERPVATPAQARQILGLKPAGV